MNIQTISGGVCAPKGFLASGIHCGYRKHERKDLALIYSPTPAVCAGVTTQNKVKAAPVVLTDMHIKEGTAQAIICNSGNANACTEDGMEVAEQMSALTAIALGLEPSNVLVASTGVIGQKMDIDPIKNNMNKLVCSLNENGSTECAESIITTDLRIKEMAVSVNIGGAECKIGGVAKGSGMIEPNMATMLGFITTDTAISQNLLQKAIKLVSDKTFNMVSVDGDTSTNDMALIISNGLAGNSAITAEGEDFNTFCTALEHVCKYLATSIAEDGEGATKLLECTVTGASDEKTARILAKSVINSSLFKAAMFGEDANWGRALCALGYSGALEDTNTVDISFVSDKGKVDVCKAGMGLTFSEELAKEVLSEHKIIIDVKVGETDITSTAWGCDLSYDYVKINGDYRS